MSEVETATKTTRPATVTMAFWFWLSAIIVSTLPYLLAAYAPPWYGWAVAIACVVLCLVLLTAMMRRHGRARWGLPVTVLVPAGMPWLVRFGLGTIGWPGGMAAMGAGAMLIIATTLIAAGLGIAAFVHSVRPGSRRWFA